MPICCWLDDYSAFSHPGRGGYVRSRFIISAAKTRLGPWLLHLGHRARYFMCILATMHDLCSTMAASAKEFPRADLKHSEAGDTRAAQWITAHLSAYDQDLEFTRSTSMHPVGQTRVCRCTCSAPPCKSHLALSHQRVDDGAALIILRCRWHCQATRRTRRGQCLSPPTTSPCSESPATAFCARRSALVASRCGLAQAILLQTPLTVHESSLVIDI